MINLFCIRPKGFNVGNDAIALGVQHLLYQAFGEVVNVITVPATSKYDQHGHAGLTAKAVYEINQYGHGVLIGGGNLYENGELDVDPDALERLEPPLMLFSLSRGRVYNRRRVLVDRTDVISDRVIKALDRKASFALARDEATGDHLREIGCRHCEVGGCPTIFLDAMRDRLPAIPQSQVSDAFVSIRHPHLMSIPLTKQAQVYNDVRNIVELLRDRGYDRVRLLCHDHRDISFAASFPGVDYVYTGDVHSYLAMLDQCALNVSYRLHSFLPCLSFGRPAIKVSYDERACSLIKTVGLDSWNINMVHNEDVVGQVANRLDRLDELVRLRSAVQGRWDMLYGRMLSVFQEFASEIRHFQSSLEIRETFPRRARAA